MNTATTKKNMPELRFPGFYGGWREYKFGDIASFSKGKNVSKDDVVEGGKNYCIRYGELYTHYSETIENIQSRTNIDTKESFLSKENDVLIPSSGESALDIATVSCLKKKRVILGGDINVIRLKPQGNGVFFAYYLSNKKRKDIAKLAQGNSVVHLYNSHLKTLFVKTPEIQEQKKIADFFNDLDNLLKNLRKQNKALEEYKRGMTQKIFSQEIRFKNDNGKNFPDWELKKLSSFLVERNEQAPKNDEYPLMAFVAYKGVTPKGERYNREFLVNDSDNKKYKRTKYGDFIYSSNNLETGSIGLNRYGSASISPVYSIFQIGESCDYQFMSSYLVRKSFLNKMVRYRQGVVYGQWKIRESDFLKIEEKIPSLEEQQKISAFLGSIDNLINLKEKQISSAEIWKKGLLQKMFV